MAFKHTAQGLRLLRDGAPIHGLLKFKYDIESIRPSHIDRIVEAIYEDLESIVPGGETLAETLDIGNLMNDGQTIQSLNGDVQFNPRNGGDNIVTLDNNAGGYSKFWIYGDNDYMEIGYGNNYFEATTDHLLQTHDSGNQMIIDDVLIDISHNGSSWASLGDTNLSLLSDNIGLDTNAFKIFNNTGGVSITTPSSNKSVSINSAGAFADGVTGTTAIGLSTGDVISDYSLYVEQVVFKDKGLTNGQLRLFTEGLGTGLPANNWGQAFQAKSGTIALLTDIPSENGIFTSGNSGGTVSSGFTVSLTDSFTFTGNLDVTGQTRSILSTTITPTVGPQPVDWDNGNSIIIDLASATGDILPILLNPQAGATYFLKIIQGPNLVDVVFPSSVLFPGESAPYTLDVTGVDTAVDSVLLFYDGTNYLASYVQNYG